MGHSLNGLIPLLELESVAESFQLIRAIERNMLQRAESFWKNAPLPFNECEAYTKLKSLSAAKKVLALRALMYRANVADGAGKQIEPLFDSKDLQQLMLADEESSEEWAKLLRENKRQTLRSNLRDIDTSLLWKLFATKLEFPQAFGFYALFVEMYGAAGSKTIDLEDRPFVGFVTQIEKHIKRHGGCDATVSEIQSILADKRVNAYLTGTRYRNHWEPEIERAVTKLAFLVSDAESDSVAVLYMFGDEPVGQILRDNIESADKISRAGWHTMLHHLATASGSKPSKKFLQSSSELVDRIGEAPYKDCVYRIFQAIIQIDEEEPIEESQKDLVKGMFWSMCRFHDDESLQQVTNLTLRCFRHVPDFGPAAASVGNAGIYTLGSSDGIAGLNYLSLLKAKIRRNSTLALIQKYLDRKADESGLTPGQIEELAIPDFELMDGVRVELFGEYQLRIELLSAGKVEQQWINPHGKLQKSVPASVKDNYTEFARLKLIREQVKQIKQISAAQRERLERFFLEDRSWDMASFEQCYLKHGLVSRLAIRLIWLVDDRPCVYHSGQWQNAQAEPVEVSSSSTVAIWHPIHSDSATVLAWRCRLQALEIQQPFKQAHREIYIVTDAERQTGDYSNRMAAHIVKQYSMNALAVSRGWQYSLIGPFDGGDYAEVNRSIPAYELNARLVIHHVKEESESLSDAGMYLYVSTDQLSFLQAGQTVELEDVPPMVFSEIVRDVDLFVGVGSVASDPYWEDSGHSENYTQYWQAHGFGDLGEFAKTRKQVLEQLLPKLKIRDVASIDGKYLVIQGVRCSYKIHIGSSNVLMQPDNRYLCIVPAAAKARPSKVFLPFEGDTVLAIILSKAFLLAADDKIEDPAILSQFAGRSPDG